MPSKTYVVTINTSDYDRDLLENDAFKPHVRQMFSGSAIKVEKIREVTPVTRPYATVNPLWEEKPLTPEETLEALKKNFNKPL